jgi:methylmalonyl-CoA mutase
MDTSAEHPNILTRDTSPDAERWRALAAKALASAETPRSADGIPVGPLYGAADRPAGADAWLPGFAPFTRGRRSASDVSDALPAWDIRQLHASADPQATNAAILEDLMGGAHSVTLQLAAPGQFGLPTRLDAITTALAGVHLDMVTIAVDAGDQYLGALQCLLTLWDAHNIPEARRHAALDADPLGTLARTGALEDDVWHTLDVLGQVVGQHFDSWPNVTLLMADGRPYHNAGASEAMELAAMLATLAEYLRLMQGEGVRPDQMLRTTTLALAADSDLLMTIAKLRAARTLLWRVAEACGHGSVARAVRLSVTTSERMLSRQDPHVNILRATIGAAGAILGGADTVTVLPFTWALGAPDGQACRLARTTQLVLMEEAGLGRVLDPAGGSGAIESLTDALARRAWTLFQEIEAAGGMVAVLKSGWLATRVEETAVQRETAIRAGRQHVTGITSFADHTVAQLNVPPHPAPAPIEQAAIRIAPFALRRVPAPFEAAR